VPVLLVVALLVAGLPGCWSLGGALSGVDFLARERAGRIKRIAVLPFAYRGGDGEGLECTMCPEPIDMKPTSRSDAELATAFYYEALTRHPRFEVVSFERAAQLGAETAEEMAARLREGDSVDAFVVGALIELRPRFGDPSAPQSRAAATFYVALVDSRSGERLWARRFDGHDEEPGVMTTQLRRLTTGDAVPTRTAKEVLREGEVEVVAEMSRVVD